MESYRSSAMTRRTVMRLTAAAMSTGVLRAAQPASGVMTKLSIYMSEARERALPADVIEKVKHHILDTFAAMISGSELAPGRSAIQFARAYGSGTALHPEDLCDQLFEGVQGLRSFQKLNR